MERGRLASECAKLDPAFEKALADEDLNEIMVIPILAMNSRTAETR